MMLYVTKIQGDCRVLRTRNDSIGVLWLFYGRRSLQEPTVRDNSVKSIKKAVLYTSPLNPPLIRGTFFMFF